MRSPPSAAPSRRLRRALALHRAGRADQAAALYADVLRQEPDSPDALHLLGMLHLDGGRPREALPLLRRAAAVAEHVAVFHNSLGLALSALGEHRKALPAFLRAAVLRPGSAQILGNLARTCMALDAPDEALAAFRQAVALAPGSVELRLQAAEACRRAEAWDEAAALTREAVRLAPDRGAAPLARILCDAGRAREAAGDATAAQACYREALAVVPECDEALFRLAALVRDPAQLEAVERRCRLLLRDDPARYDLLLRLGLALSWRERWSDAVPVLRAAARVAPGSAEAWYNLGVACHACEAVPQALRAYRRALRLEPESSSARNNLGNLLKELALRGRTPRRALLDEAEEEYRAALRTDPASAEVHHNLALLVLLRGRLREGFREYEWRARTAEYSTPGFPHPVWNGEALEGEKLLVYAEQGLGDTLQFCRYLHFARARCSRVMLACHRPLVGLLAGSFPDVDVVPAPGAIPLFDRQVPLMSLPRIAETELATVPGHTPYLFAHPLLAERWRRRMRAVPGVRVGLAWRGNPGHRRDAVRSVPAAALLPLLSVPGVTFFSLQKGAPQSGEEVLHAAGLVDPSADLHDIQDTAALVSTLDLVISCDTSVLHLAGALGVNAWAMLAASPDWRWLLERDDSPWYPTLRLFRQQSPVQWAGVVSRLCEELRAFRPRAADAVPAAPSPEG